jgi:hypothetical protein
MSANTKKQSKKNKLASFNKTQDELKKKIPFTKLLYLSLAVNFLVIIFFLIFRNNIPPEIPLFYGFPEGQDQLTQRGNLVLPSLVSIITIVLNSSIAYFSSDDFIKKTLVITGFALTFLSVVTTIKIAFLVGSY